jgi:hypothetical protein
MHRSARQRPGNAESEPAAGKLVGSRYRVAARTACIFTTFAKRRTGVIR